MLWIHLQQIRFDAIACFVFQLMDMGFTREHAIESLQHTTSLEQATEFILTHPPPAPVSEAATPPVSRLVISLSQRLM